MTDVWKSAGSSEREISEVFGSLRVLRLDDDDSVRSSYAVQSRADGVLQDFNGGDVVGIDSCEPSVRSWLNWKPVDHVQGLVIAVEGRGAPDVNGDAAIGGSGYPDAGDLCHQNLFDWLVRSARKVVRSY